MSDWIKHVKAYAADHGIPYKEALSQAKATYTPKPKITKPKALKSPKPKTTKPKTTKSKAPKGSTQSSATTVTVSSPQSKTRRGVQTTSAILKKTTLSNKEGRAALIKLLPDKVLTSPSIVKLINKYDTDVNFRNSVLRLTPEAFKESILTEAFGYFKTATDKLAKKEQPLQKEYNMLRKLEASKKATAGELRELKRIKDELNEIKEYKKAMAKEIATVAAIDSNIGADLVTPELLHPDLPDTKDIESREANNIDRLKQYYNKLPSLFKDSPKETLAETATRVLQIQDQVKDLVSGDVDNDPLILYIEKVADALPLSKRNSGTRVMLQNYINDYIDAVKQTKKHSQVDINNLLGNLSYFSNKNDFLNPSSTSSLKTRSTKVPDKSTLSDATLRSMDGDLENEVRDVLGPDDDLSMQARADARHAEQDAKVEKDTQDKIAAYNAKILADREAYNKKMQDDAEKYTREQAAAAEQAKIAYKARVLKEKREARLFAKALAADEAEKIRVAEAEAEKRRQAALEKLLAQQDVADAQGAANEAANPGAGMRNGKAFKFLKNKATKAAGAAAGKVKMTIYRK